MANGDSVHIELGCVGEINQGRCLWRRHVTPPTNRLSISVDCASLLIADCEITMVVVGWGVELAMQVVTPTFNRAVKLEATTKVGTALDVLPRAG